jgi:hypothetical protein
VTPLGDRDPDFAVLQRGAASYLGEPGISAAAVVDQSSG